MILSMPPVYTVEPLRDQATAVSWYFSSITETEFFSLGSQTRQELSSDTEAISSCPLCPRLTEIAFTKLPWPRSFRTRWLLSEFQTATDLSALHEYRVCPSLPQHVSSTAAWCPFNKLKFEQSPKVFHRKICLSMDADAICCPSGEKATENTSCSWPVNCIIGAGGR